jgi:peptide/nickel transport system substrate-binding protein
VPLLTQQLPTVDNGLWKVNVDGTMVTTFRLHPDAQWHDGTPITADDFLFSLEVGRDREVPAFGAAAYASIGGATAPDPFTLVVNWKEPYVAADALFSWDQAYGAPLPRHLLQEAATTNKVGFLDLTYWLLFSEASAR